MKNKVIDMFSGKTILQNEGEKYSDILNNFIKPFENDFSNEMDIDDVIGFACNAWNLGCMSQIVPKEEFENLLASSEYFLEPENTILKKMIDFKTKKFASFDRFIDDFELEEKNGELVLTVLTQEKEAFLTNLMEEHSEFLPEEIDFKEGYINRYAIVVKPLQPFFDWLNSLNPKDDAINEVDEANVYLVDNDIDDIEKWLRKKFDKFFTMELDDWHTNKKEWPQYRSYKMFKQWFSVDISTMVYDMENRPVYKED
jgi:hypothetical protein